MSNYRRFIVPRVPAFTDKAASKYKADDLLTKEGAMTLVAIIKRQWAAVGRDIDVRVERVAWGSGAREARGESYCVRSNMINGIPSVRP